MLARLKCAAFIYIAGRLLAIGRYDGAQACLVRVLNNEPELPQRRRAYAGLAQTEYHRAHFLNARHYARLFLDSTAADDSVLQTQTEKDLLAKVNAYHEASQEQAMHLRRR